LLIEGSSEEYPPFLVENYPGFPGGIDRHELIDRLKQQAREAGATLQVGWVKKITPEGGCFQIDLGEEKPLMTRAVIIATGRSKRKLGLEKEADLLGKGIGTCAWCEGPLFKGKQVVVAGGGEEALEQASLLSIWATSVTLLVPENTLTASPDRIQRTLSRPNITVYYNIRITGLSEGQNGWLNGVFTDNESTFIPAQGLFVALGVTPNSRLLSGIVPLDEEGYILTQGKENQTLLPGLFAAGDVVDPIYQQLIFAAASGCHAALQAKEYLAP
jgi:thioredoxin reductase (NADPH)